MRIPDWTPHVQPRPQDLVDDILARRGGAFLNLDKALLWSEPLARGWNHFMKHVRTGLGASRKLRELGICTVALLTGARYEYIHHAPDFLAAGGTQDELAALETFVSQGAHADPSGLAELEALVVQYATAMTRSLEVDDELFRSLQSRLGTTDLVEVTAAIAAYNMVARFLIALDVTPET